MKSYLIAGLAALSLSGTAYAAEVITAVQPVNGKSPAKVRFELRDKHPILLGVGIVDTIVSNLDFLHRYVERVPIERPNLWDEKTDLRRNVAALPSPVYNVPNRNPLERRGSELGAALANKGLDYLLHREHTLNTNRDHFDVNLRPTRGGGAMYFKLTFNKP